LILSPSKLGPFYDEKNSNFQISTGAVAFSLVAKMARVKTHLLRAVSAVVGEAGLARLRKLNGEQGATSFVLQKALNRRAQSEGKDRINLSVTLSYVTRMMADC
jgi:hypothetical protein